MAAGLQAPNAICSHRACPDQDELGGLTRFSGAVTYVVRQNLGQTSLGCSTTELRRETEQAEGRSRESYRADGEISRRVFKQPLLI